VQKVSFLCFLGHRKGTLGYSGNLNGFCGLALGDRLADPVRCMMVPNQFLIDKSGNLESIVI
jgi:hypothetical protein